MPPKKRKAMAADSSEVFQDAKISMETSQEKPRLMAEGLTKSSAKRLFNDLQNIWGDFVEHDELSRVRRFLATDIKNALTKEEKGLFLEEVKNQGRLANCGDLDLASLFPEIQEVIDFKFPAKATTSAAKPKKRRKKMIY